MQASLLPYGTQAHAKDQDPLRASTIALPETASSLIAVRAPNRDTAQRWPGR
jgi:hypothetical protein